MHRAIWAVKKAHWRTWAVTRRLLRKRGLTPARLDVLECLAKAGGRLSQTALTRALAVVKSTVSEQLAKMEKLGLVTRTRRTRRGRDVIITARGEEKHELAFAEKCEVDGSFARAYGARWNVYRERLCVVVLERLCKSLRRIFGEQRPRRLYELIAPEPLRAT